MPRPTGPTDPGMQELARQLRKRKEYAPLARQLSRPRRAKIAVNVGRLNKVARENEMLAVAGKVLSAGEVSKPINVYAWKFSRQAREKIEKAGGKCLPLSTLAESAEAVKVVV